MQRNPETGLPGTQAEWLAELRDMRRDVEFIEKSARRESIALLFADLLTGYVLGAWLGW